MTHRTIPEDLDWLSSRLAQEGITLDPTAGQREVRAAVNAVPRQVWTRVQNSWRQRQFRRTRSEVIGPALNEGRILGPVWEQLIRSSFITRADAETLAAGSLGEGIGAYNDGCAREIVAHVLHKAAAAVSARRVA